MSVDTHSRAAKVLDIPVDATASDATSTFLARLPAADLAPSGEIVAALNTLAGLAVPSDAEGRPALSKEVEEFAHRYWSLAPADRLAAWLTLSTRSPDDLTADWLLYL